MKPAILKWIYLGLIYILIDNFVNFYFSFFQLNPGPKYEMPYTQIIFFIIKVIFVIISSFGLIKKYSWARWVCFGVLGFSSLSYLYTWTYVFIVTNGEVNFQLEIIFGLALLFLSYKVFFSEALRIYLKR